MRISDWSSDVCSSDLVNLDMEEYRDLDLTVAAFTRLLSEPELHGLEAGIVLQAYLPDSLAALEQLMDFALRRRDAGGAGIKVRFVKGANLSMERVDAELHGWAQAPYDNKADVDASSLRLLDRALVPGLSGALRVGAASHHVSDLGLAHPPAARRGVAGPLHVKMPPGHAPVPGRGGPDTVAHARP